MDLNQNMQLQYHRFQGDNAPDGMQYEFEASNSNKMPIEEVEFLGSDEEVEEKEQNQLIQGKMPEIQEEVSVSVSMMQVENFVLPQPKQTYQLLGIVLVKELKNPNNQNLSRKDVANAFNVIFKQIAREYPPQHFELPRVEPRDIMVEPILSSGILKGSVIITVGQTLFDAIMDKFYYICQTLQDIHKLIERDFSFNFYDLKKIKEKHAQIQNGRYKQEFVQVHTDKNVSGRRTTQILFSMHVRDGQIYAIKKVKLHSFPTWEMIYNNSSREIREIRAMLRLSHKNVLRLFSWWFEEEIEEVIKNDVKRNKKTYYLYLQTEYLAYKDQSSDLLEFIYVNFEYMRIPINQRRLKTYTIFNQILDGIQYVHEQGLYHRDIKPENILVTENCWGQILIKICDFDFAKDLPKEDNGFNSVQSQMTGTLGYVSHRSGLGQKYDIKEEIFMLGMVLLDLCKLYPEANNRKQFHANALENTFPTLVQQQYPEEINLIRAMIRDQQYQSIQKLRDSKEWAAYKHAIGVNQ